jgi:hypothetical protein
VAGHRRARLTFAASALVVAGGCSPFGAAKSCEDYEQRTGVLTRDAALAVSPAQSRVIQRTRRECDPDGGWAVVGKQLASSRSPQELSDDYVAALPATGWRIVPERSGDGRVCATKQFDGWRARLVVTPSRSGTETLEPGEQAYWLEMYTQNHGC